jgi:hypothetical protein
VPGLLQYDALPGDSSRRGQEPTPARPQDTQAGYQGYHPQVATTPVNVCGEVIDTRSLRGFIRLFFYDGYKPPVGTEVEVYHDYVLGTELAGTLVIRDWEGNQAIAAPRAWEEVKVSRGDHVECVMQVPASAAPAFPPVPEVQTAVKQPTPAAPPAPTPAAKPAAPATNVAATTPAPPARKFIPAKPVENSAATTSVAARPASAPMKTEASSTEREAAEVVEKPSFAESSLSAVQRVFSLSKSKASSPPAQPTTDEATRPAMTALSKAVPSARSTSAKAVPAAKTSGPAPIIRPSDLKRTAPAAQPTVAAAGQPKSTSPALAEMLRLPSSAQQRSPMGDIGRDELPAPRQAQAPIVPAPVVRPQAKVVPASANLPTDAPLIERLPPIVSPTEARRGSGF